MINNQVKRLKLSSMIAVFLSITSVLFADSNNTLKITSSTIKYSVGKKDFDNLVKAFFEYQKDAISMINPAVLIQDNKTNYKQPSVKALFMEQMINWQLILDDSKKKSWYSKKDLDKLSKDVAEIYKYKYLQREYIVKEILPKINIKKSDILSLDKKIKEMVKNNKKGINIDPMLRSILPAYMNAKEKKDKHTIIRQFLTLQKCLMELRQKLSRLRDSVIIKR